MRPLLAFLMLAVPASAQSPPPAPAPPPSALVSVRPADPAPIGVTLSVAPGTIVALDASGSAGDRFAWESEADTSTFRVDSSGKRLYFASPNPGTYAFTFHATGIVDGHSQVSTSRSVVTVGGSEPAPPPSPLPPPTPAPGPTPNPVPPPLPPPSIPLSFSPPAFVTLVYDSGKPATMTPLLAALRDSRTIGPKVAALNAKWVTLDAASPEFARRGFSRYVAATGGAPFVVIQGSPPGPDTPMPPLVPPFPIVDLTEDQFLAHLGAAMKGIK